MKPNTFLRSLLAMTGSAALAAPLANAATISWDPTGGGASDGAGAWLTAGDWWDGASNVNWTSGDDAIFGNGGAGDAVTLAGLTTVNSLTLNSFTGTYTLGTSGQAITLNSGITMNYGSGAVTIISPITLGGAQSWNNQSSSLLIIGPDTVDNGGFLLGVGGTGNTTVTGLITGSGGLTKADSGSLTLSGANDFTGLTSVNGGSLIVDNNAGSGSMSSSSGLTFGGSGTFIYLGADTGSALSMDVLTFNAGEGTVQSTYGTSGNTSLTFTSLAARTSGAVGNFSVSGGANGTTNQIVLTGQAAGFIDKGIYFGSGDYASYDAGGFVRAFDYTSDANAVNVTTSGSAGLGVNDATKHVRLANNRTGQTTASIADLKLDGAQSLTLNTDSTLTINGILKSGGGTGYVRGFTGNNANHFIDNGGNELTIRTESSADTLSFAQIGSTNSRYITLQGAGGTTISGPGTVNFRLMANTTSGPTNIVNAGTVLINDWTSSFGTATNVTLNGGIIATYANGAITTALGTGAGQLQITGGASGFNTGNGAITFSNNANAEVVWGSSTFNPSTFALAGGTLTFANKIDLNGANRNLDVSATQVTMSGVIRDSIGSGGGLTKTGGGKLILTGNNTFTGNTIVNGGTLRFGSSWSNTWSGYSLDSSASLELNGGIAEVWYNTTRTLGSGSGQIQITGGRSGFSQLQTDQSPNIFWNFGNSSNVITWGSASFNPSTLVLNNAGASAVLRMNNPFDLNGASRTIEVSASGVGGGRGTYATMEGALSGSGASLVKTGVGTLLLNGNNSYDGGTTINGGGLWFNSLAAMPNSGEVTVNDGGILSVSVGGGGQWTAGSSGNGTIGGLLAGLGGQVGGTVTYSGGVGLGFNLTGSQTYSGDIADVGTSLGLYIGNKDGGTASDPFTTTGTLTLSGNNTYTGGTTITSGTLQLSGSATLGSTSATLTVNGGTLDLNGSNQVVGNFTGTGGTIELNGATNQTFTIGNGNATGGTFNGVITDGIGAGVLALTKTGTGKLILGGANTYSGDTIISGGILQIGNNTAGRLGGGNYAGNISIASGATLAIWSSVSQTLSGVISGDGKLDKAYGGVLTLSGDNTYTGKTTFLPQTTTGFTVNISSFNSVVGGFTSSSLGAPTTVSNGTIDIGSSGKRASVTLNYTGNGETTDRVLKFGFNSSSNQTIMNSGSGLLKFTSSVTSNTGGTGALILGGSGDGEFVQGLPSLPSGGLKMNGTGTWTLSGSNSYTGATAVNAGMLNVTGTLTSAVTVATNAILSGNGTTTGTLSLSNGSTIVGNTVGSSFKANTVTATSSVKVAGSDGSGTIGSHTIGVVRYNTGAGPTTGNFSTAGYHAGASISNVGGAGGETQLTYTNEARTWDTASGNWDAMVSSAWQEGDLKFGQGDAVVFDDTGTGGGSARSVTLNSLITAGSVTFNNSTSTPYTVSGTGTLAGLMGLTKTGTGTVTLATTNNYTGTTDIINGTLQLDGSTHTSSTVAIGTAGTLSGSGRVNGNATLTGNGVINKSSGTVAGTLDVTGGNWNGAGAVTGLVTSSSGTFTIGSGANLTANGNLDVTGGTLAAGDATSMITGSLNYSSSSSSNFAGVIDGSGKTLTLNNASAILTLTGTNTYSGATNINAGTLVVNGSIASSSLTTVASGATIGGSGTIGALTVSSGGFINPGNSPDILTVAGDYIQAGRYTAEITGLTAGFTGHDQIGVTGTVDITGGSLTAAFSAGSYAANNLIFLLLNDGVDAITGTYAGFAQGATVTNYGGFDWQISYVANSGTSNFLTGNDIALMAVNPIPEPSVALLGCLGLLTLLRRRAR